MTARINRAAVLAIAGRDLCIVSRSRAVLIPMLVVPGLLLLTPPSTLIAATTRRTPWRQSSPPCWCGCPATLSAQLPDEPARRTVVLLLVYVFAPLYLLVPVMGRA